MTRELLPSGASPSPATLTLASSLFQFADGHNSGIITALASAPAEYGRRYAGAFGSPDGPCIRGNSLKAVQCKRTVLPRGELLWTYVHEVPASILQQPVSPSAESNGYVPVERIALVLERDGSALALSFSDQSGTRPGGSLVYLVLTPADGPSQDRLGDLAVKAAAAWRGTAPDVPVVPTASAAPSVEQRPPPGASAFAVNPTP